MATRARSLRFTHEFRPELEVGVREFRQIVRQLPFAASRALNDVALAFQSRQREWQEQTFEIRAKGFFRRAVKLNNKDRASVKKLVAIVVIDARPSKTRIASSREDIFVRQQEGGIRTPKDQALAIPTDEVDRTTRGLIKKKDFPDQLKRDFAVDFADGSRGLFQRIGRRQKAFTKGVEGRPSLADDPNVRFLFALEPKARIEPQFNFFVNANIAFSTTWDEALRRRLDEAFENIRL